MKQPPEDLAALGWQPCDPPRVTLGFRWPYKEIIKCQHCNGRGFLWMYDQGHGKAFGQCYKKRCSCRGGSHREVHLDAEFQRAMVWFKGSKPPSAGFELYQFKDLYKVIEDPVSFWKKLWLEISSGNIYRLEAIRDDVVKLHQKFILLEEEF